MKKIDETRKRANDIVGQRRRNMDMAQEKLERQKAKLEEQQERTRQNLMMKDDIHSRVQMNKAMATHSVKQVANETKMDKNMTRQAWMQQKDAKVQEAHQIKTMIK